MNTRLDPRNEAEVVGLVEVELHRSRVFRPLLEGGRSPLPVVRLWAAGSAPRRLDPAMVNYESEKDDLKEMIRAY